MRDDSAASGFETFFVRVEPRLRLALTATFGDPVGRETTVDELSYAWEHWERVRAMEKSAGFLYVVGRRPSVSPARHSSAMSGELGPQIEF